MLTSTPYLPVLHALSVVTTPKALLLLGIDQHEQICTVYSWQCDYIAHSRYYCQINNINPQGMVFADIGGASALCHKAAHKGKSSIGCKAIAQLVRPPVNNVYEHKNAQISLNHSLESPLLVLKPYTNSEVKLSRKLNPQQQQALAPVVAYTHTLIATDSISITLRTAVGWLLDMPNWQDFLQQHIQQQLSQYRQIQHAITLYTQSKTPAKVGLVYTPSYDDLASIVQLQWLLMAVARLSDTDKVGSDLLTNAIANTLTAAPIPQHVGINPFSGKLSSDLTRYSSPCYTLPCQANCILEQTHAGLMVDINSQHAQADALTINQQALAHILGYIHHNGVYGYVVVDILPLTRPQQTSLTDYINQHSVQWGLTLALHISPFDLLEIVVEYPEHKTLSLQQAFVLLDKA